MTVLVSCVTLIFAKLPTKCKPTKIQFTLICECITSKNIKPTENVAEINGCAERTC